MRMDQLEYFFALTSLKTIQAVSEKFYTSPQVVSKALKQLESELNTTLFIRTRKGTELTESGNNVYPYIEEILNNYNHLKKEYMEKSKLETSNINILSCKGTAFYFSNVIKSLNSGQSATDLTLILKIDTVQSIKKILVQDNPFDLIATACSDAELEQLYSNPTVSRKYDIIILKRAPIRLFMSKHALLTNEKSISLKTIKTLPLILYNIESNLDFDRYLKENHHTVLNYPFQVSEISLAMDLLKENKGYFFATEHYIANAFSPAQQKNVVAKGMQLDFFEQDILLFSRNRIEDATISMMVKLLKDTLI